MALKMAFAEQGCEFRAPIERKHRYQGVQMVEEVEFRLPLDHGAESYDAAGRHEDSQYPFHRLLSPHDANEDVEQQQEREREAELLEHIARE